MSSNPTHRDWHVTLHVRPQGSTEVRTLEWQGWSFAAADLSASELDQSFETSFDDFVQAINRLPHGYAEGDGSFGLVGPGGAWKLVGTLFEVDQSIHHVELMGSCPLDELDTLIGILGAETENCLIQMMHGGFFVSFAEFQRWN